jgi:hypothetical protein
VSQSDKDATSHVAVTNQRWTDSPDANSTFERRRLRVYIAGPISKGDVAENIRQGLEWGRIMLHDGLAPYIPHLDSFLFGDSGEESGADQWKGLLEWDVEWVAASEVVFRIPGESKGADLECRIARSLRIPVYHSYGALLDYAELRGLRGKQKVTL